MTEEKSSRNEELKQRRDLWAHLALVYEKMAAVYHECASLIDHLRQAEEECGKKLMEVGE